MNTHSPISKKTNIGSFSGTGSFRSQGAAGLLASRIIRYVNIEQDRDMTGSRMGNRSSLRAVISKIRHWLSPGGARPRPHQYLNG
jgi:hypothetical protein